MSNEAQSIIVLLLFLGLMAVSALVFSSVWATMIR